jgi:FixJ family two-component response regulator
MDYQNATGGSMNPITKSEAKILLLVGQYGLCNKELAAKLGLSTRTVEKHRANIGKKIGLSGAKFVLFARDYFEREA